MTQGLFDFVLFLRLKAPLIFTSYTLFNGRQGLGMRLILGDSAVTLQDLGALLAILGVLHDLGLGLDLFVRRHFVLLLDFLGLVFHYLQKTFFLIYNWFLLSIVNLTIMLILLTDMLQMLMKIGLLVRYLF